MKISKHFDLCEFTRSAIAAIHKIDNTPSKDDIRRLRLFATCLLEPLRAYHGLPLHITSGYRSAELNRRIGGAPSSQHMTGEAADIRTVDILNLYAFLRTDSAPDFDQAIYYRYRGFLHLSFSASGNNRRQCWVECK